MSTPEKLPGPDWHPFTPRGVAHAASAPRWQLWIALGSVAALWSLVLVSFLIACWQPVVDDAIENLPPNGYIRSGVYYPESDTTDVILSESSWLSIGIHWNPLGVSDQTSDFRVTLQIDHLKLCSILGCAAIDYRTLGDRSLGRADTMAWWNAWRPFFVTAIVIVNVVFLFITWWLLTLVYSAVVRFQAFYRDRQTCFASSCRVAQASLLPGALWLTASVFFYQRGWLDLFGLLVVGIVHVPVAWLYFSLAVKHLPAIDKTAVGNPFKDGEAASTEEQPNPFSR